MFFFTQSNCSFDKDPTPGGRARAWCRDKSGDQHSVPFNQLWEAEAPLWDLHLILEWNGAGKYACLGARRAALHPGGRISKLKLSPHSVFQQCTRFCFFKAFAESCSCFHPQLLDQKPEANKLNVSTACNLTSSGWWQAVIANSKDDNTHMRRAWLQVYKQGDGEVCGFWADLPLPPCLRWENLPCSNFVCPLGGWEV